MKQIHFYNAKSRLGLLNIPFGDTVEGVNTGVENGGTFILNALDQTRNNQFKFTLPEEINNNYFKILAKESDEFANLINESLADNETQFILGGDHSVAYSSLLALSRRIDLSDVLHIQIDSHTDIHLSKTSPSGNFHGMWLRPFITEFDNEHIESLVTSRLKPENILFVGNIVYEEEEVRLVNEENINIIDIPDIQPNQELIQKKIKNAKHVHLTIDVDGFDRSIAPATGIPAENGLFMDDIEFILRDVSRKDSFSVDLVEFNPDKEGTEKTLELCLEIIEYLR